MTVVTMLCVVGLHVLHTKKNKMKNVGKIKQR